MAKRILSDWEREVKDRMAKQHAESAYYEAVKKEVIKKDKHERMVYHEWKLMFYDEKKGEKLMVFNTGTGFALSVKGGGHPVVKRMFENKREFDDWFRKFARSMGYKENTSRRNGRARFYI